MNPPTNQVNRFIAIDAHKHYLVIGGLDAQMNIVLPLRRVDIHRFPDWARQHLLPSDTVVIEASTNTWTLYDVISPLVASILVANPYKVRLIAASRVKTDKLDVWALARLLVADLIPQVWVPPTHVRELRALISHRRRLSHASARARNRLHSVLHRHNLWVGADRGPPLRRLTTTEPWASSYPFLVQLPGFGLVLSMTILSAIGDISRFPSPKKLVGYAGLGASVHDSGKTHRTGRITKQGRKVGADGRPSLPRSRRGRLVRRPLPPPLESSLPASLPPHAPQQGHRRRRPQAPRRRLARTHRGHRRPSRRPGDGSLQAHALGLEAWRRRP
jgi:transposase